MYRVLHKTVKGADPGNVWVSGLRLWIQEMNGCLLQTHVAEFLQPKTLIVLGNRAVWNEKVRLGLRGKAPAAALGLRERGGKRNQHVVL